MPARSSRASASPVPGPGEWNLSLWRRDAAGNASEQLASVPVDPAATTLIRRSSDSSLRCRRDPTLVAVKVTDAVSGFADGAIEISAAGSGTWHTLPVTREGDRMLARVDDAGLPPGPYELRARASDLARNEASTQPAARRAADGARTFRFAVVSTMQIGVRARAQRRARGASAIASWCRPRPRECSSGSPRRSPAAWSTRLGVGVAGSRGAGVSPRLRLGPSNSIATVVQTDAEGRYRYAAAGSTNRTLRFVYAGSATVLPSEGQLAMTVPAATELRVSRTRLRNGQSVTFTGPVRTLPTPPGGKLIEMQVKLPGRWETFRTIRSDDAGQWSVRYRFRRTRGRAALPVPGATSGRGQLPVHRRASRAS